LTIAAELVSWISLFSRSTCFHLYEHYCWLGTTFNSTSIQNVYVEMFNLIDFIIPKHVSEHVLIYTVVLFKR
jgi:hypothetical protein